MCMSMGGFGVDYLCVSALLGGLARHGWCVRCETGIEYALFLYDEHTVVLEEAVVWLV